MKIATLQVAPELGKRDKNIRRADEILANHDLSSVDLLVLPEMAFSGYNFPSLETIKPYLEPTTAGPSTDWARATAARLGCHVCIGYPEASTEQPETNYNAQVIVSPAGAVVCHYRKSFLYYTDETWAAEGGGFAAAVVPAFGAFETVVTGICMDINPYKFQAAWDEYEFATYGMQAGARLVVLSTAWLTSLPTEELLGNAKTPDYDTINYWLNRFTPLMQRKDGEQVIVVFANRCGLEPGQVHGVTTAVDPNGESVVGYAGSSCIMGFSNGLVRIWNILGRAKEGLLLIDTELPPVMEVPVTADATNDDKA
ncbi:carbon-nitrogen hydrolase [Myriangium duriaei CBS 260.36]|uniref:Carbon-nitrogen hydrolase n=1 Tax=Myriangium duriaei CBS 260.36 TaxID=1168546 RepID=A0A9P4JFN5_9PEZI|nr:carbon-nitrogen hydrolase [Myriangium duriaei CBS 260.36]